nr:hypothetical protein [Mycobacterium pseudoshottsii]
MAPAVVALQARAGGGARPTVPPHHPSARRCGSGAVRRPPARRVAGSTPRSIATWGRSGTS